MLPYSLHKQRTPAYLLIALLFNTSAAGAADFCVTSPAELQDALTVAASNAADDHVKIVQGNYTGNFVYGSTEPNDLIIEGGYSDNCISQTVDANNTVLDGNATGRVITLSAPDGNAEFVLRGLTIQNGDATPSGGGGIYADLGDDTVIAIDRNRIYRNSASDEGGGLLVEGDFRKIDAQLIGNEITENSAREGGGVRVGSNGGNITFEQNTLANNEGRTSGGGAYVVSRGQGNLTVKNNEFTANTARLFHAGGLYVWKNSGHTVITHNVIAQNRADDGGGGAYIAQLSEDDGMTIAYNLFRGNQSDWRGSGAYVESSGMHTTIQDNLFTENRGAIHGGGIYLELEPEAGACLLGNNTFSMNEAQNGAGLALQLTSGGDGAAAIKNNLLWQNQLSSGSDASGADFWIDNDDDEDHVATPFSLLNNNFSQTPGQGYFTTLPILIDPSNLDAVDPVFVNEASGDFGLRATSPMIDAGDTNAGELSETDLAGNPRVVNGVVDIGAYEWQGSSSETCSDNAITISNLTVNNRRVTYQSAVEVEVTSDVAVDQYGLLSVSAPRLSFGPGFRIGTTGQLIASAEALTCTASPTARMRPSSEDEKSSTGVTPRESRAAFAPAVATAGHQLPLWVQNQLILFGVDLSQIQQAVLDFNGSWIVIETEQALVVQDTNNTTDIYHLNLATQGITLVSATAEGFSGNGSSQQPAADASGELIVFSSEAGNLVPSDQNEVADIFLVDLALDTLTKLTDSQFASANPALDAQALELVYDQETASGQRKVLGQSILQPTTEVILSLQASREGVWFDNHHPGVSADGRYLTYLEESVGQVGRQCRVHMFDRETGVYHRQECPTRLSDDSGNVRPMFSPQGDSVNWYVPDLSEPIVLGNPLHPKLPSP